MEPESPERLPSRLADERTVLLNDTFGLWSREEVEVEGATQHTILDERLVRGGWRRENNVGRRGTVRRSRTRTRKVIPPDMLGIHQWSYLDRNTP